MLYIYNSYIHENKGERYISWLFFFQNKEEDKQLSLPLSLSLSNGCHCSVRLWKDEMDLLFLFNCVIDPPPL